MSDLEMASEMPQWAPPEGPEMAMDKAPSWSPKQAVSAREVLSDKTSSYKGFKKAALIVVNNSSTKWDDMIRNALDRIDALEERMKYEFNNWFTK